MATKLRRVADSLPHFGTFDMSTLATTTTRIQALDDQQLPGASAKTLAGVKSAVGMVPNLHRTLAHSPAALDSYVGMASALSGGVLSPHLREKIALAVAAANGCAYCASAHTAIGAALDIDPAELARSLEGQSDDPRHGAALAFVDELLAHRGRVPDLALQGAREAGLSEAEIVEIATHVGMNLFTNMFIELARTEIDFPRVALTR